jgi:hypothetical protein
VYDIESKGKLYRSGRLSYDPAHWTNFPWQIELSQREMAMGEILLLALISGLNLIFNFFPHLDLKPI